MRIHHLDTSAFSRRGICPIRNLPAFLTTTMVLCPPSFPSGTEKSFVLVMCSGRLITYDPSSDGRPQPRPLAQTQKEVLYEYDFNEGRHADLLQRLGQGAARRLQPRLAAVGRVL